MKLGLYMATQWRQGADLGPELANLIEQVRAARASGLASLMVGQHFVSSPLQMFQAMPLLARLAAEAEGRRLGPGPLLPPPRHPAVGAGETPTPHGRTGGAADTRVVAVQRAAQLADAWMPSPMVTEENVGNFGALFRDTRKTLGLPAAKEFPIIRECHVGSGTGNALDEVREPLFFKYEAYAK